MFLFMKMGMGRREREDRHSLWIIGLLFAARRELTHRYPCFIRCLFFFFFFFLLFFPLGLASPTPPLDLMA